LADINSLLILFGIGLIAGFINVMAGGGSTLTLPALIFLGLNSALANGTNRVAILIQNITAVYSFKKEKYHQFDLSMKLSLLTLPGAVIGALVAIKISDALFQKILGIIILGIIISMVIPKNKKYTNSNINTKIPWYVYPVMVGIGFYGGFIQAGIGFIIMAALQNLLHLNLVYVNMHKVFIVLIYTIPALFIFIITKNVDWFLGLSLAAGNAIGAWWAVKFSVKRGEKIIRYVLIIILFFMAFKLLNIF
jgi:uncharacterized protein